MLKTTAVAKAKAAQEIFEISFSKLQMISKTSESIPLNLFHRNSEISYPFFQKGAKSYPKLLSKVPLFLVPIRSVPSCGSWILLANMSPKNGILRNKTKGDDSMNVADQSVGKGLKEVKNAANEPCKETRRVPFLGYGYVGSKNGRAIEKIDVNDEDQVLDLREVLHCYSDEDQVLDLREVLHCYSHLTVPVYIEIVKKVLMDMHKEVHILQNSKGVSNSMRMHCSARVYSSMRCDPGHLKL